MSQSHSSLIFWIIEPSRVCCFFPFFASTNFSSSSSSSLSLCFSSFLSEIFPNKPLTPNPHLHISLHPHEWTKKSMISRRKGGVHMSLDQFLSLCFAWIMSGGVKVSNTSGIPTTAMHCYQWLHLAFRIQLCQVEAHLYHNLSLC